MSDEIDLSKFEYIGKHPFQEKPDRVGIGPQGARFVLRRTKKRKSWDAVYDLDWHEVVSYECCIVNLGEDDYSWPIDEEPPEKVKMHGQAGMVFFFLTPEDQGAFQIWAFFPPEDLDHVQNTLSEYLERPPVPGLAHHGNAAVVKYMVDHCTVLSRVKTEWHDWIKTGPLLGKPRKKRWRERGPDYVFCEEGMAIDFYGAGEQLEQMSTFWPWRVISTMIIDGYQILYQWYDDNYVYRQQVWDKEQRAEILKAAKNALKVYRSKEGIPEVLIIRPWTFPSRFYRTWDKLEPLTSKASRNRFPPILDFDEEDI